MLTWEFPPRIVGGISRHCVGLAEALVRGGHEVCLVTLEFPGAPEQEVVNGVEVHRTAIRLGHPDFLSWVFLFNHFMEKKVAEIGGRTGFDVIHIHDWLTAPAGISAKYFTGRPLVATMHSTEVGRSLGLHSPNSFTVDGLEWWATYESKRVIVTSGSMKDEVFNHFRLPPEKVAVIPNAIDTEKYRVEVDRDRVKRLYGVDPHERLVLFVGRLIPQKGVEHLIRAAPNIVQRHKEAKIVIVGDGWQRSHLEGLSRSSGCGWRIRFTGFLPDSELVQLMEVADVLVVPSVYEPFGIVALEGMAAGVPVVTSQVGGLAEIVKHDRTGVYVYPGNPDSITWGVDRVLSDPGYSRWLTHNARDEVQKAYSWEAVAKRTVELYQEVVRR